MIEWLTQSAGEVLGLLCLVGVATGIFRWNEAKRRDILLAFIVVLFATAAREIPVYLWGLSTWPPVAIMISGAARLGQIVGAVMFVRASFKGHCPEWGVWLLLFIVFLVSCIL
jgi:hypothetical protein